jgi:hypothetical protein
VIFEPFLANFHEKALFVKADLAAPFVTERNGSASFAMLPFAVNKLREVAGGVSDWPDPSIRRPNSAFRVTCRSFHGGARDRPKGDRGGVS